MLPPLAAIDRSRGVAVAAHEVSMSFSRDGAVVDALAHVTLDIPAGSFCAILGPSGCGKSTLMMLMAGLTRPTRGSISLDGTPLAGCFTEAGIVFQRDVLMPWLNVVDNVLMPARVKRLDLAQSRLRARDLLEKVGLAGFETHFPDELSGGMRQRVAICRALLAEPRLLLMDEPFGALDALTRERMQNDLTMVWTQDAKTILLITHDIEEAVLLADMVVVMSPRPGRILQKLQIDLPRPRGPGVRREPRFQAVVEDIRDLFRASGVL